MIKPRLISKAMVMTILMVVMALPGLISQEVSAQESQLTNQERMAQRTRGAQAWSEQCGRCHNIRSPNEFTDDIWDVSVNHMRVRANIPGNVIRDIKAFLKASN